MSADDALLFIDSNKYLDLYRTDRGKTLLSPLAEQVDHIFVTQQVVSEVQRNKIQVAAGFLAAKLNVLKIQTFNVPDHLSGASTAQGTEILGRMSEIAALVRKVNDDVDQLAGSIVEQISSAADEVSVSLSSIFAKAVPHSADELRRARERRELGNPPGKLSNPLGDQLTWEQILTHFRGKKRLWIISRDGDYGTVYGENGFLNQYLLGELQLIEPDAEVYLFSDLVEGLTHFVDTTGVKADSRLSPHDIQEIELEEQTLPPLRGSHEEGDRSFASAGGFGLSHDDIRRAAAEILGINRVNDEMKNAVKEMGILNQAQEDARRTMQELARHNSVAEHMRNSMKDITGVNQAIEDARRTMQELARHNSVAEHMRNSMKDITGINQAIEDARRTMQDLIGRSSIEGRQANDEIGRSAKPDDESDAP